MDYITRARLKAMDGDNRIIPEIVFVVDPNVAYAQAAAKELAEASIILSALTAPKIEIHERVVVESVMVERVTSLPKRIRNALLMMSFIFAIAGAALGIGFVEGNEMLQAWKMATPSEEFFIRGNFDRINGR